MRELFILATTLALWNSSIALQKSYEGYQVLEVKPVTQGQIEHIHKLEADNELDFWLSAHNLGDKAHIMVPPHKLQVVSRYLKMAGLIINQFVGNVGRLIEENGIRDMMDTKRQNIGFDFDDYHPYSEIMVEMEAMVARCPVQHGFRCETYVIGQSFEGRDLKVLRIYKDEPNRKGYWMDSAIHAREWLAPATNLKFAQQLLTEYSTDSRATFLLDSGDWYFLFIHNPDGYVYSWESDRMWRKNRRINEGSQCFGVDLNRNYEFKWAQGGSSTLACSGTYHGTDPASEPETQAVQAELSRLGPTIEAMWSIHTYGQYYLHPWGNLDDNGDCEYVTEPHQSELTYVVNAMADATETVYGTSWRRGNSCDTIYAAAGLTIDYAHGVAGIPFAFTPELRGRFGGFVTPKSEIALSFDETFYGLVTMVDRIKNHCALLFC